MRSRIWSLPLTAVFALGVAAPGAAPVGNVGETGRLVFSRATGYLPYLQTAKGRFPFRPLAECREDPLCLCSHVRLVEDLPSRIVVHWRHVPDPARARRAEVVPQYL